MFDTFKMPGDEELDFKKKYQAENDEALFEPDEDDSIMFDEEQDCITHDDRPEDEPPD